jgi:hypothetical protein
MDGKRWNEFRSEEAKKCDKDQRMEDKKVRQVFERT